LRVTFKDTVPSLDTTKSMVVILHQVIDPEKNLDHWIIRSTFELLGKLMYTVVIKATSFCFFFLVVKLTGFSWFNRITKNSDRTGFMRSIDSLKIQVL
jgi:hypothetical protein